jgi:AraC-like DNA-binding protein
VGARLLSRLAGSVAARFERLRGFDVVVLPVDLPEDSQGGYAVRPHPLCAECSHTGGWPSAWREHLGELMQRPEAHVHHCEANRWCAVVPVRYQNRCLAACKLVCIGQMGRDEFDRNVELLTVLVEAFTTHEAALIAEVAGADADPPASVVAPEPPAEVHPKVREAMEYIERHTATASLTVARVAQHLGMNSTYLGHLFTAQVGMRMSRYIADRRIELAKTLLVTTDWPVKQVAFESGHRNSDWFTQAFGRSVGLTPGEYRRRIRASASLA